MKILNTFFSDRCCCPTFNVRLKQYLYLPSTNKKTDVP